MDLRWSTPTPSSVICGDPLSACPLRSFAATRCCAQRTSFWGVTLVNADLIKRLITAFNAHDAAAFAGAFTDDGVMYAYPDQGCRSWAR